MGKLLALVRDNKWTAALGVVVVGALVSFGFDAARAEAIVASVGGLIVALLASSADSAAAVKRSEEGES